MMSSTRVESKPWSALWHHEWNFSTTQWHSADVFFVGGTYWSLESNVGKLNHGIVLEHMLSKNDCFLLPLHPTRPAFLFPSRCTHDKCNEDFCNLFFHRSDCSPAICWDRARLLLWLFCSACSRTSFRFSVFFLPAIVPLVTPWRVLRSVMQPKKRSDIVLYKWMTREAVGNNIFQLSTLYILLTLNRTQESLQLAVRDWLQTSLEVIRHGWWWPTRPGYLLRAAFAVPSLCVAPCQPVVFLRLTVCASVGGVATQLSCLFSPGMPKGRHPVNPGLHVCYCVAFICIFTCFLLFCLLFNLRMSACFPYPFGFHLLSAHVQH